MPSFFLQKLTSRISCYMNKGKLLDLKLICDKGCSIKISFVLLFSNRFATGYLLSKTLVSLKHR